MESLAGVLIQAFLLGADLYGFLLAKAKELLSSLQATVPSEKSVYYHLQVAMSAAEQAVTHIQAKARDLLDVGRPATEETAAYLLEKVRHLHGAIMPGAEQTAAYLQDKVRYLQDVGMPAVGRATRYMQEKAGEGLPLLMEKADKAFPKGTASGKVYGACKAVISFAIWWPKLTLALCLLVFFLISQWRGGNGGRRKMMKAPGRRGAVISRRVFEGNTQGYFRKLHHG